jgi:hypothetical protein
VRYERKRDREGEGLTDVEMCWHLKASRLDLDLFVQPTGELEVQSDPLAFTWQSIA